MKMKLIRIISVFIAIHILISVTANATPLDSLDSYNVTWDSPSSGPAGSMPVGNGDIGLNVWVEEDGDLLFYIGKTDAWSSSSGKEEILLKLGRIRVQLEPNPFQKGMPFNQQLQLRQGRILILAGDRQDASEISVWVDANHPVIHVESKSSNPVKLNVSLETWREEADKILATSDDRIAWHHRDEPGDFVTRTLKKHNLEGAEKVFFSASGSATRPFNGLHPKSNLLAVLRVLILSGASNHVYLPPISGSNSLLAV
jgi:hypothetical protein